MSYVDRTPEIKAGGLLDIIRERPAMYLGEHTLTGLWHFLQGFHAAAHIYGMSAASQLPRDLHDWVAYRLHYYSSTSGWRNTILKEVPDEPAALARFYELLDEYRARKRRVVATIRGHHREYCVGMPGSGEAVRKLMPEVIMLVAYTDDPGLFLTCDGDCDFPEKDRLAHPRFSWSGGTITVLDQVAYDRWRAEESRALDEAHGFKGGTADSLRE